MTFGCLAENIDDRASELEEAKDLIKQVYPKAANGFTVSSQVISKRVAKELSKAWKMAEDARKGRRRRLC